MCACERYELCLTQGQARCEGVQKLFQTEEDLEIISKGWGKKRCWQYKFLIDFLIVIYFHLHQITEKAFIYNIFRRWKYIHFTSTNKDHFLKNKQCFRKITWRFRKITWRFSENKCLQISLKSHLLEGASFLGKRKPGGSAQNHFHLLKYQYIELF